MLGKIGTLFHEKAPLDVRIVVWLLVVGTIMELLIGSLLVLGIGHSPPNHHTKIFWGLVVPSDLFLGVYTFAHAVTGLIGAYGLARLSKFGWWFVFFLDIYGMSDAYFRSQEYPVTVTIGICLGLATIVWLIYRRQLYGIGARANANI